MKSESILPGQILDVPEFFISLTPPLPTHRNAIETICHRLGHLLRHELHPPLTEHTVELSSLLVILVRLQENSAHPVEKFVNKDSQYLSIFLPSKFRKECSCLGHIHASRHTG